MRERETVYLHDDVIGYMEGVRTNYPKDYKKLNIMIQKLAEKGHEIIDGRMYKKFKTGKKLKRPIIQITIIAKQYRIHTALTDSHLYLLHAFDKKKNKTPKNDLALSIKRAETIT